jgi:outer membrane protein, multidrug efflux system
MNASSNRGTHHAGLCALLLLAALAEGCASHRPMAGANYQPPVTDAPAAWTNAVPAAGISPATPAELAQWWRVLGDAQLDALVDEALAGGKDLKLAAARVRQARAARVQARSALFPAISASANQTHRDAPSGAVRSTTTLYDAGFDATWEIDLFGAVGRSVEAADADLQASQARLDNLRVTLVAEVVQTYVELRGSQQRLAIARDNLASQDDTVQLARWRNQAGLVSTSDVDQAIASREQTRATIPVLDSAISNAQMRLAVLLGQQPGALQAALAQARPLPAVPTSVAVGIPADALRRRPDLIAAERTLAAETARTGAQQAQRFPSLNLAGSFGWQAYSRGALGTADSLVRTVAGTLAGTLFDAGRLRSAVEIRSAVQEQALLSYQAAVLAALEEVENALFASAAAQDRIDALRTAADAASRAAATSRQMYQAGLSDFQRLLDAERARLSAQDALASAQAARLTALVTLYKALGGGWQPAATPPSFSETAP